MTSPMADKHLYRMDDVFYPRGHVFALLADAAAAQAAAASVSAVRAVGPVAVVPPEAIIEHLGPRADKTGGLPSVGREHQFMLRFVELARAGRCGLLIAVDDADPGAVAAALASHPVELAYLYRLLVIEELVESTKRANDAAAGEL
ncbi:MAG: hypothetical protein WCZ18_12375 [Ottowia sp.]|nr:hypothetical protein [Ottowia sp.]